MKYKDIVHLIKYIVDCGVYHEDITCFYIDNIRAWMSGYLAYDKDKIVGCVLLTRQNGFPTVKYLYVAPSYRRKRIGWFLVNMCMLRAAKDMHYEIRAYVDDTNIPAQELFKKLGFKETI
jgi:ribosomal protein S18 acetylase RimI-like enzyme